MKFMDFVKIQEMQAVREIHEIRENREIDILGGSQKYFSRRSCHSHALDPRLASLPR